MNGWGGYRPPTWQHPVGWNTLHETPPVITAPVVRERPSDLLFNGILRPAWAYRLELALIGLLWAVNHWLTARLGAYDAAQVILALAIVVGLLNWTRDPLAAALFRSHLRRRWALACRHANLATRNDRVPRITRITLTRAGEQLRVRVPAGGQVPDLEAEAERLAAFLAVREVRVTREPDKRGTGLSDRVTDDRLPDLETRMDDVRAVMDAAGSQRAFLLGHSEGGLLAALFATTYPARTAGVVFFSSDVRGAWAPDHIWGTTREEFERELDAVERGWGNGTFATSFAAALAPSLASDEDFLASAVRYFRQSASPSAAIAMNRMWFETDARAIVRSLGVPSLVLWRRDAAYAAESRYLAEHVPGAIAVELPGSDHLPWVGDVDRAVDEIEAFISAVKDEDAVLDRLLATVLVTDIVGSTQRARELGDRAWGELLEVHHGRVRAQLARFRGREIDTAGDGFLATFDGPARGVRCAQAIARSVRGLGIAVRAGVHTGELELVGGSIRGIAVHVGARVCGIAGADEVLVTSTVRDLVAGSGLVFQTTR